MIKKNNKAFTLVELLAVLIVLSGIMGLVISSFSSSMDKTKEKQVDNKITRLKSFAEIYVTDYKKEIYEKLDINKECYISASLLRLNGYFNKDVDLGGYVIFDRVENSYTYVKNDSDISGMISCSLNDVEEYNVTFDANGGSVDFLNKTIIYGGTYGGLPTVTRAGHTFKGWYTALNGGARIYETTKVSTVGDHTLYAMWQINKYNILFDANGGSVETTKKEISYGEMYGELPVAERNGYTFVGWYTMKAGGIKITNDDIAYITANQTLYAQWTANTYTITYDDNGGLGGPGTQDFVFDSGEKISSVVPTKTGYTFSNWLYSGYTFMGGDSIPKGWGSFTLTAQWASRTYTVTFNANGGTVSPSNKTVIYSEAYGDLPTPTRSGYEFNGWYTETSGGTHITKNTIVSIISNQTLYAQWTLKNYDAILTEEEYAATISCSGGRTVSETNCTYYYSENADKCGSHEEECWGCLGLDYHWDFTCDNGEQCSVVTGGVVEYCCLEIDGSYGEANYWAACNSYGTTTCTVANSCTKIENQYRTYSCSEGGTLSGTTCKKNVYTCPYGGTLSGTTCVFN